MPETHQAPLAIGARPVPGARKRGLRSRRSLAVAAAALAAASPALLAASPATASTGTATLAPPPVTILSGHASRADGDIFISPFGDSATYANGAEILSNSGKVVWFHPVPAGQEASDFRTQTY